MSALIVVDEWLYHDLRGDNGDEKQEDAFRFLFKFIKTPDKMVILRGSPFEKKMFKLVSESENNESAALLSKLFHKAIMVNSSKTVFLERDQLKPITPKLLKLIPSDDQYLFEAHLNVKKSFILTTDGRWPQKLVQHSSVKVKMRDAFLKSYLKN